MQIKDSSRITYGTRISPRIWQDSNNQLICRDAIIARTGSYDYLESEIVDGGDKHKIVKVFRTDDEVFDPKAIASFENKPFVDNHPQEDVSLDNFRDLSKGFMRDVRRGTGDLSDCLICDIVVTDPETIEEIKSGRKRELSLGYDANIVEKDGNYYMTNIRGNHLALVDSGRAGCATIRDSAQEIIKTGGARMSKKSKVTLFDDDIFEVEEITPEDDDLDIEEQVTAEDDEPTLAQIYALLQEIKSKLDAPVTDDDDEVEEVKETEEKVTDKCRKDDDEELEEEVEEEDFDDDDEELTEEESEDELLDADEILEETEEEKMKDSRRKTRDSKSVYKKFAKVTDSRQNVLKKEIRNSWQDRYNHAAKKSF